MRSRAAAPIPSGQAVVHVPSRPENMFDEQGLPLPYIHLPLLDTFFPLDQPPFSECQSKAHGRAFGDRDNVRFLVELYGLHMYADPVTDIISQVFVPLALGE